MSINSCFCVNCYSYEPHHNDESSFGNYRPLTNNNNDIVTNQPQSHNGTSISTAAQSGASDMPTGLRVQVLPKESTPTRSSAPTKQLGHVERPPARPPVPPRQAINQQHQQEKRSREQHKKQNDKKSNKVDDSGSTSTLKRFSAGLFGKKQVSNEERLKQLEKQYVTYFPPYERLLYLNEKRNSFPQEEIQRAYKCILKLLLKSMLEYKRSLLEVPEGGGTISQGIDQNEQYKVYGLMLSACIREGAGHGSHEAVKQKIVTQCQFLQEHEEFKIDTSVNKALSMTWSMLTLLPPLLVTKPQCEYSEDILDTNRLTWDEDKSGPPLTYYRPVLVYGNRLHVAVKGLVGNSTRELHS